MTPQDWAGSIAHMIKQAEEDGVLVYMHAECCEGRHEDDCSDPRLLVFTPEGEIEVKW